MSQSKDKEGGAHDDFLAEAQELVEHLSRDLLILDDAHRRGQRYVEPLGDLFRGVHTLKGLSGMFGFEALARLSHVLEDLLEGLRLGRVDLGPSAIDLLFEGVEMFQRLLADTKSGQLPREMLEGFAERVAGIAPARDESKLVLEDYGLDPSMLAVLTEYEEHRLRESLSSGLTVYRVRVSFALETIDTALESLKERVKHSAEIITYLPSMEGGGSDAIEIEMLMATRLELDALRASVDRSDAAFAIVSRAPRPMAMRPPSLSPARSERPGADKLATEGGGGELSLRSLANVVRVDIRKLDHLMNVVGELGTVRAAFARVLDRFRTGMDPALASEAQRVSRAFARHLADAQESVLDIRMVPLSQLFDKVAVVVRQLAREQEKDVRLLVTGGDTEVDKLIAEELADPLMHIVRNAIDHGIETTDERDARGKPRVATLAINAYQKGSSVVIELSDDGRGIDPDVVRRTALDKGLTTETALTDFARDDMLSLVFLPGFSTAAAVTDVSGRGVGMDVVKTNITRLGGAVELDSELGVGTKVTITLPITLAIISALLFEAAGRSFALPLSAVQEALRLDRSLIRSVEGREVLSLRGSTLFLCRLIEHFRFTREESIEPIESFVIVIAIGQKRLGLVVDRLLGQQDLVIKGLGRSLASVQGIAGAADMGDHRLLLVLDAAAILEEVLVGRAPQLGVGGMQ